MDTAVRRPCGTSIFAKRQAVSALMHPVAKPIGGQWPQPPVILNAAFSGRRKPHHA